VRASARFDETTTAATMRTTELADSDNSISIACIVTGVWIKCGIEADWQRSRPGAGR
jgi:hypothetical protein